MLTIKEKSKKYADIICSDVDGFSFTAEPDSPNDGQVLEFQVTMGKKPTFAKRFELLTDTENTDLKYFIVNIKPGEMKLPQGVYTYRLIVYDEYGVPSVGKSGRLAIKWGA